MKVLLSYKFDPDITPLGFECERAFVELGHSVTRMEVDNAGFSDRLLRPFRKLAGGVSPEEREKNLLDRRNAALLKLVESVRPDLVFIVIGYNYYPETLEKIRTKHGTKIIAWWVEYPPSYEAYADTFGMYDAVFTFSTKAAELIGSLGSTRCEYVNYGTDTTIYRPMTLGRADLSRYGADVSFLGKHKPRREELLSGLEGDGLHIWGPMWTKELAIDHPLRGCVTNVKLFGDGPAKLFSASKVNVNINSWDMPYGPNLRVFDVPASGGFLLTEYVHELDELFSMGEEIETFRDKDELSDKARYYIRNDSVRTRIAEKGYRKVTGMYRMTDRLRYILERI